MKTTEQSVTAHAIEVAINKKQRSIDTLKANFEKSLTEMNSDMAKLRSDLIKIKEQELEELRGAK